MSTDSKDELLSQLHIAKQRAEELAHRLATVGHEVKTPIGIAVTAASNLELKANKMKQDYQAGKMTQRSLETFLSLVVESADILQTNTRRASSLMDSFKQIALDQAHERTRSIKLADYFEQLKVSLLPALREAACDLSIDCSKELQLSSCPGAVTQVLSNLIMNALQHARVPEKSLAIQLKAESQQVDEENPQGGVKIQLSDNGAGMSPEVKARAFESFYTTASEYGGSGLGLSIVAELLKRPLMGKIDCRSQPGEGCDFHIFLPNLSVSEI
ncbi:sensor histidine kinase [Pseudoteredinibacter isoporae]|uniref:sensor histidine kinase n=1 Tax=Pseudoteredinibacter isoporae TaxID=570281 RepID=UPI003101E3DA